MLCIDSAGGPDIYPIPAPCDKGDDRGCRTGEGGRSLGDGGVPARGAAAVSAHRHSVAAAAGLCARPLLLAAADIHRCLPRAAAAF